MIRIATLCLATYWLAIFVATHLPKVAMPGLPMSDKAYHVIAFSGLSFLLAWALPTHAGKGLRHLGLAATIAIAYACVDELTQHFIPGRHCDPWDVVADAVGTGIGLLCYVIARLSLSRLTWGQRIIRGLSR